MNTRILELIKHPEAIQIQDLELLNAEVQKHPFLQNLRALHLLGTHQFNREEYKKELAVTAAYTTDKKILYQLVNKKTEETLLNETIINPILDIVESKTENTSSKFTEIITPPQIIPEPVLVEGILNRILFKGEEDFLERETANIDFESTLESGKLVTTQISQNVSKMNSEPAIEKNTDTDNANEIAALIPATDNNKDLIKNPTEINFQEAPEFLLNIQVETPTPEVSHELTNSQNNQTEGESTKILEKKDTSIASVETIVNESEIAAEENIIENSSEISFHVSEEFLPQIQIKSSISEPTKYEIPKAKLSKQEEEMQRLIAEVEAKIKASKKPAVKEVEFTENADVNFSSTQEFKIEPMKTEEEEKSDVVQTENNEQSVEKVAERNLQIPNQKETEISKVQNSTWKPMSISATIPDSFITKKSSPENNRTAGNPNQQKEISAINENNTPEDRAVFNVSFFTPNVSSIESKKHGDNTEIISTDIKATEETEESNIPIFINTWQNWLKIDRKAEVLDQKAMISKEKVKNSVIEKFIEKEPKISKLKDESDFVVKEKGSNISHLMTETLANLYVEQKLYAKAIKAYEVLIGKHPQKEKIFTEKIQEIKDLRKNS